MKRHAFKRTFGTVDWDMLTARTKRFNGDLLHRALHGAYRNINCADCGLWKRAKVHR